jgi:hypothetical protein
MLLEVARKLGISTQPVIEEMFLPSGMAVTAIGLSRGVTQYYSATSGHIRMLVIKGEVDFNTTGISKRFACYESYDIPVGCIHSIEAWDDAIVLLFKTHLEV